MAKLHEDQFHKILDGQIEEAISWQEEHYSRDRKRNYEAYLGQADAAPAGRSQAVSWDVFETIEAALPDLIEILCSGDHIAEFEPVGEEDEQFAEQATDYINYVVMKQNPGFLIFNTWIKDALLSKIGVVRAYWATSEKVTTKEYTGISDDDLTQLLSAEDAEVIEQSQQDDERDVAQRAHMRAALNVMDPMQRQLADAYLQTPVRQVYDVTIRTTRKRGRVYVDNVQPENFIITPRAKTMAAADLVGEIKSLSRSDMRELGYDKEKVREIQSFEAPQDRSAGIAQTATDESHDHNYDFDSEGDDATEEVRVFDGFIRVDYDGDGIAEWRRVVRGSNVTLVNEEAEGHDFAAMSPILIPHSLIGIALADPVVPIQTSSTAMQRQYIDSLMLANNPRTYVNTTAGVNLNDLLDNRIGGIVRGTQPMQTALAPLLTHNVADSALQGIEFNDSKREARTGITRYNQGLDADSLNKTATGVAKIMTAGDRRKLMMARIMAETGIKDLFRLLLRIVTENQDKPATVRLRNQWVQVDPSPWSAEMDVSIETGVGTGDKSQLIATLQGVLSVQKEALAAKLPIVTLKNIYNTLAAILKAAGLKGVDKFFTEPQEGQEGQAPGQPEEAPETALAQAQVEAAKIQLQGKQMQIEADRQKAAAELEIERVRLQQKQVELQMKEKELAIKQAEALAKAQVAAREQDRKDVETAANLTRPQVLNGPF